MVDDDMRAYWDERARRNAVWYVDTDLAYGAPDMDEFLARGERVVTGALDDAPIAPDLPGHERAVEIGCGVGRVCRALAARFDEVVGVDVSPEMLERARELVPDERVRFVLGDGATLAGVESSSADLVLSFVVFQHIPRQKVIASYLREAGRVCRPGGLLAFQWNNLPHGWWWALRREVLGAIRRLGVETDPHQRDRHAPEFLGTRVPVRRIRRWLDEAGFDLVATTGERTIWAWAWARRRP